MLKPSGLIQPTARIPLRQSRASWPRLLLLAALIALSGAFGCEGDGAPLSRQRIRSEDVPRVKEMLRQDIVDHRVAVRKAAEVIRPIYAEEDPAQLEKRMRQRLQALQEPPRGILELIASPLTFLTAVASDGIVIARDREPDKMRGEDFGQRFPIIDQTLHDGEPRHGLVEFPSPDPAEPSSFSMIFVHPVTDPVEGRVMGAVVAGIPLWRWAQRCSRQIRVERAKKIEAGLIVWVYLVKGEQVFHFDTPPELDAVLPEASVRRVGLEGNPGGFTGHLKLHGKSYGYGMIPLPYLGDDVALLIVRSDP